MIGLRYYRVRGVDLAAPGTIPARSDTAAAGPVHRRAAGPGRRAAGPVWLPGLAGAPRSVIRQRVANLDVVFAIDDSESVHGPDGTDPGGARNAACLSVIDLMHRHGCQRHAGRCIAGSCGGG
jgi:hypothetical protein